MKKKPAKKGTGGSPRRGAHDRMRKGKTMELKEALVIGSRCYWRATLSGDVETLEEWKTRLFEEFPRSGIIATESWTGNVLQMTFRYRDGKLFSSCKFEEGTSEGPSGFTVWML